MAGERGAARDGDNVSNQVKPEPSARKPYREPQLVEYGLLSAVTQGGAGSKNEQNKNGTAPKKKDI